MIKCTECRKKFSYGRKISCCSSTFFGMIFLDNKNDHIWNCITPISKSESSELNLNGISRTSFMDDKNPRKYNWNCNYYGRNQHKKDLEMEMSAYIKAFE